MFRTKMSTKELTGFLKKTKPEGTCLIWTGAKTYNGYGVKVVAGVQIGAHRAAYQHYVGPIPKGLEVHHICRRKDCVDYKHMILLTHKTHMRTVDRSKIVRSPRPERTHCRHGHELTPDNIWGAKRLCRQCNVKTGRRRGFCLKGHPVIDGRCALCARENVKKWRKNNKEKVAIYKRKWTLRQKDQGCIAE